MIFREKMHIFVYFLDSHTLSVHFGRGKGWVSVLRRVFIASHTFWRRGLGWRSLIFFDRTPAPGAHLDLLCIVFRLNCKSRVRCPHPSAHLHAPLHIFFFFFRDVMDPFGVHTQPDGLCSRNVFYFIRPSVSRLLNAHLRCAYDHLRWSFTLR